MVEILYIFGKLHSRNEPQTHTLNPHGTRAQSNEIDLRSIGSVSAVVAKNK